MISHFNGLIMVAAGITRALAFSSHGHGGSMLRTVGMASLASRSVTRCAAAPSGGSDSGDGIIAPTDLFSSWASINR